MQDMKLVEAINDLRDEVRRQGAETRGALLKQTFRLLNKALLAVVILGLAASPSGQDLVRAVVEAWP